MPANSDLPDNPQRISFACDCGAKLVAKSIKSGKRIKCSSCGEVVVVPSKPHAGAGNPRLIIALCSLAVVIAIGGGAMIYFVVQPRGQAPSSAAKSEVKVVDEGAAERAAERA